MKNKLSFDEYDALVNRFEKLDVMPSSFSLNQDGTYFPTPNEIKKYIHMPEDLDFVIWLIEMQNGKPVAQDEKESQKLLKKMLYEYLEIY